MYSPIDHMRDAIVPNFPDTKMLKRGGGNFGFITGFLSFIHPCNFLDTKMVSKLYNHYLGWKLITALLFLVYLGIILPQLYRE